MANKTIFELTAGIPNASDANDAIPFWDGDSGGSTKKVSYQNLISYVASDTFKKITNQTSRAATSSDEIVFYDASLGEPSKRTLGTLLTDLKTSVAASIVALTNLTGANLADDDEFYVYDTDAAAAKNITRAELVNGLYQDIFDETPNMTSYTEYSGSDLFTIYDFSASTTKKVALASMVDLFPALTEATLTTADEILVRDDSASDMRKITIENLVDYLETSLLKAGVTNASVADVDADSDYFIFSDSSDSNNLKKTTIYDAVGRVFLSASGTSMSPTADSLLFLDDTDSLVKGRNFTDMLSDFFAATGGVAIDASADTIMFYDSGSMRTRAFGTVLSESLAQLTFSDLPQHSGTLPGVDARLIVENDTTLESISVGDFIARGLDGAVDETQIPDLSTIDTTYDQVFVYDASALRTKKTTVSNLLSRASVDKGYKELIFKLYYSSAPAETMSITTLLDEVGLTYTDDYFVSANGLLRVNMSGVLLTSNNYVAKAYYQTSNQNFVVGPYDVHNLLTVSNYGTQALEVTMHDSSSYVNFSGNTIPPIVLECKIFT